MKVLVTKDRHGNLRPADQASEKIFWSLKEGELVVFDYHPRENRSPQQHRWLWAVIRHAHSQLPEKYSDIRTPEELLDVLKTALGYFDEREVDGKQVIVLKSISFGAMSQSDFHEFMEQALWVLAKMLGVTPKELEIETRRGM